MQKEDEYGDEEEDGDQDKEKQFKEKPVLPVFHKEDFLFKWLEDNPEIEIPDPIIDDKDNDWYMNEDEEEALINAYFQSKGEQS